MKKFIIIILPMIILIFTLFLYSLHLPSFYKNLSDTIMIIYISAILFYILGSLIPLFKSRHINEKINYSNYEETIIVLKKYVNRATILAFILFFIEIIVLGFWNIPIFSDNPGKAYVENGLPVIHNYVVLLIFSGHFYFLTFLILREKKYLFLTIIIFIVLGLGLSKGIMIMYTMPLFFFLLFISKHKLKISFFFTIIILLLIYLPNLIRERGKEYSAIDIFNNISGYKSDYLVSQIIYMYTTSVHYVFNEEIKDLLMFGNFSNIINPFLSLTFTKFFIGTVEPIIKFSGDFYNGAWNVKGGIASLYQDFGLNSVIMYSFIYGFIISFLYIKRNTNFFYFLIFAEIYSVSLLLFYSDFLKSPIFLFLITEISIFMLIYKIKSKRK